MTIDKIASINKLLLSDDDDIEIVQIKNKNLNY